MIQQRTYFNALSVRGRQHLRPANKKKEVAQTEGGVAFSLGSHSFGNYTLKTDVARMRLTAATSKITANSHMHGVSNLLRNYWFTVCYWSG